MSKLLLVCSLVFSLFGFMGGWSSGQEPAKAAATDASSNVERGISLAVKGRCKEALTFLAKVGAQVTKKELKYDAEMSTARCAMSLGRTDTAVKALLELNRARGRTMCSNRDLSRLFTFQTTSSEDGRPR
jgi:hypothetical protein